MVDGAIDWLRGELDPLYEIAQVFYGLIEYNDAAKAKANPANPLGKCAKVAPGMRVEAWLDQDIAGKDGSSHSGVVLAATDEGCL